MRGPARHPRVDHAVVAAVDDQARSCDAGRVAPGRAAEGLGGEGPDRACQGGVGVAQGVAPGEFGDLGGEPGRGEPGRVAEAGGDDVGHPRFGWQRLVLAQQPGTDPRHAHQREPDPVRPGPGVGQGRGDQGQCLDEFRAGGRELHADRAAQGVGDQVDRAAVTAFDQRGDRLGQRGDVVAPVGAGPGVAETRQVERVGGQRGAEQVHQVGPVPRRAGQPVHAQRGFPRAGGAAHVDLMVAEGDRLAGPVRDRLLAHAVFPARLRGALRHRLPSSLLRRSSVQATPRPFGSLMHWPCGGSGAWRAFPRPRLAGRGRSSPRPRWPAGSRSGRRAGPWAPEPPARPGGRRRSPRSWPG
jgi:hypothetical protein